MHPNVKFRMELSKTNSSLASKVTPPMEDTWLRVKTAPLICEPFI